MPSFLKVECYAGYKADQRPLRFSFVTAAGRPDSNLASSVSCARTYQVTEVLDRWYGPDYECFKVRANDHNFYVLRHQLGQDAWSLDSFRRDAGFPSEPAFYGRLGGGCSVPATRVCVKSEWH